MNSDDKPCTVWRLITHHAESERALAWSRKIGRIAVGWGGIGDLRANGLVSASDTTKAIQVDPAVRHTDWVIPHTRCVIPGGKRSPVRNARLSRERRKTRKTMQSPAIRPEPGPGLGRGQSVSRS